MILQALTGYYEDLLSRGKLEQPGWSRIGVSYALNLSREGGLLDVIPLREQEQRGKKTVMIPKTLNMPTHRTRASGILAFFLCDNSAYFLGVDNKGKPKRAAECFEAAKALHLRLLSGAESAEARAVSRYFSAWRPENAGENAVLKPFLDDILAGANLVFTVEGAFAHENTEIRDIWRREYEDTSAVTVMQCLITGREEPVAILHPVIKGVRGAQSSGALLVSYNAPAFNSYERRDGLNAPVGKYAAFAYGAALNYLLSDRKHTLLIGDTTVAFWAEGGESAYQDIYAALMNGPDEDSQITDADLTRILNAMAKGQSTEWDNAELKPSNHFYVLGLAPNAARLAVRFFLQDSFGNMTAHIRAHYGRLKIVRPQWDKFETLPVWKLLNETVNQNARDKTPQPQMAGDTLRAILTDGLYPATLLNGVMLRIKVEHEITRGRSAIIKAVLIKNYPDQIPKEALTVELNEQTTYQPYLLGRLFSVLEQIQQTANPGINATIRDRYFNSACATPAVIFPLLIKLSGSHLRKLETGYRIHYERQITSLLGKMANSYPQRLGLPDQGVFQLGYYHQTQKRYEKKNNEEEKLNVRAD